MSAPKITFELPVPPSLNNAYLNVGGRGRIKSAKYRSWLNAAAWTIKAQRPGCCGSGFTVDIILPRRTRGDCDNRIKPCLDALVAGGAVRDDRDCQCVSIRRGDVDQVVIELRASR